jgi:Tol biopolymer transport system component
LALLSLVCLACAGRPAATPTPTPNVVALETEVASKLAARLTAQAPPATHTPTLTVTPRPSPTPSPKATLKPTPTLDATSPLLAYVRVLPDQTSNVFVHNLATQKDEVLTRFLEPLNMSDVTWSRDGMWLILVSAHDFIHSRNNERNVFLMRPDGGGLRMLTGDYVDPNTAPPPYVVLRGQVMGAQGSCLVCAQGAANPVTASASGTFELPGVPSSARWVRAVCRDQQGTALQGDVPLTSAGALATTSVAITVEAKGQGWTQAALSRDGKTVVGTYYHWALDKEGKRKYENEGLLQDLEGKALGKLALPKDTALNGATWSPVEDQIIGALSSAKNTWLWKWDAQGTSVGALTTISNTEQAILSAGSPVVSPDGKQVAFTLRSWYWWGENKYKTDLAVVPLASGEMRILTQNDWGTHVGHPAWSWDSSALYYQSVNAPGGDDALGKGPGNIWMIPLREGATPTPWSTDNASYLPALRPVGAKN